ncbi:MAG: putative metal-binding motif-containing protein [Deltaproteobacteria bacterium]|nr:putative metal-binding motif-containing protein [Deltaproteobacteria bacterium]
MSTSRQRCGSWLAWAVALAAGCADGGKGGEGAGAGADSAPVDCAASPLDCDGEDNDCDGVADEGGELEARQLWGVDADADGYPAAAPTFACAGADGERAVTEAEALDCDDARSEAHPGAVEDCDAYGDEDCNGVERCADPACASRTCAEVCDDGFDNDLDGQIDCHDIICWGPPCAEDCAHSGDEDDDGAPDCRDPECWRPECPELCSYEGDEDADGLADCEDADCADECVEVCDDLLDNDRDGAVDCDDPDCVAALRCWTEVELRSAGPLRLRHNRRWYDTFVEDSGRAFALEVPTLSVVGRVRTAAGGSTTCALHAGEVDVLWSFHYHDGPASSTFSGVTSRTRVGTVGPVDVGCPPIDVTALLTNNLRLGGYSDRWFRTVVLLDVGRSWALDGLTIGPADRRSEPYIITSTWGPYSSIVRTTEMGRWGRSTTTATAVGFAPLP